MMTLAEIEKAVVTLPMDQQRALYHFLSERLEQGRGPAAHAGHGILDIPTVSVGSLLKPIDGDDDLLAEMLQDRV